MAFEPAHNIVIILPMKGDVIHRPGPLGSFRHRDPFSQRVRRVGFPLRDVDAGRVADINPVARKFQRWPLPLVHPECLDIEVPRGFDVIRQDQIVFDLGQWHGSLLARVSE